MAHRLLQQSARLGTRALCSARRLAFTPACLAACKPTQRLQHLSSTISNSSVRFSTLAATKKAASGSIVRRAVSTMAAKVAFEPDTLPSVSAVTTDALEWVGDLLVIGINQEDVKVSEDGASIASDRLSVLDSSLNGVVAELLESGGFEGKQGQHSKAIRVSGQKAKHISLVGMGSAAKLSVAPEWGTSAYQAAGSAIATLAKAQNLRSVGVSLLEAVPEADAAGAVLRLAAGALLGAYESTRFKTKPAPKNGAPGLSSLAILGPLASALNSANAAESALSRANAVAKGALLTRYIVEAPPNICSPAHIADAAAHVAALRPERFELKVLEAAECAKLGMGLYLGVAEASDAPSKFVHLVYKPAGEVRRKVAIVGKGLTFDSGGYNLKTGPGSMIELMKFDCGGSAATLGAARILADTQPEGVEVHFIIAACENMVAGRGMRPGDILTGASGKTVEVNNTDAEGRLTLADGLWYAQEKCGVAAVVDVATLTGACIIALGPDIAGLFTPSDDMAASLSSASRQAGEKVHRMPLESRYFDQLKSPVADMKNTGSRAGGAITAALFLKEFIKEGVEWAHLDIAGPVWDEKAGLPTGYGAALLAEWATAQDRTQ